MASLIRYEPSPNADALLLGWWNKMLLAGDLQRAFTEDMAALSVFFRAFQEPTILLTAQDESGIWLALWFTPTEMRTAAFTGFWVAAERRQSREALACILEGGEKMLEIFPVLISVTKSEDIAEVTRHFGFKPFGEPVPYLFNGETAYLSIMTRDDFNEAMLDRQERGLMVERGGV